MGSRSDLPTSSAPLTNAAVTAEPVFNDCSSTLSPAFANIPVCIAHSTGVTSSLGFEASCMVTGADACARTAAGRFTASAAAVMPASTSPRRKLERDAGRSLEGSGHIH